MHWGAHTCSHRGGLYTKLSAVYVDGLALHVAMGFRKALRALQAQELLEPEVEGHESVMSNDLMLSSKWEVVR